VTEDQATGQDPVSGQEPETSPESGQPLRTALTAGPARGADRRGSLSVAAIRKRACSSKASVAGVVGVAALALVAVVLGAAALINSGSSNGADGIRVALTSSHSSAATSGATITVTGNGQVEGTPDTAEFAIGVSTTAPSAVAALEQNNKQVTTIELSLKQHGVDSKDIQTSDLELSANTDSRGNVTGFSVDDELNVTMTDLSNLGVALDAAVQAAGNGVTLGGISFSVSNQSALLASARAQAMLSARTEADQVATGAGLALGPIVKVTDQENAGQYVYYGSASAAMASNAAVPVETGQQQISVQVSVVYRLVNS